MAEYYPLLAKAVASLPNSSPDSRKLVYERARKALIGQLRTLHPPVPEADIESESLALDRAIERLETELGTTAAASETSLLVPPPQPPPVAGALTAGSSSSSSSSSASPSPGSSSSGSAATGASNESPATESVSKAEAAPVRFPASGGALGPSGSKPVAPLRTKLPPPRLPIRKTPNGAASAVLVAPVAALPTDATAPIGDPVVAGSNAGDAVVTAEPAVAADTANPPDSVPAVPALAGPVGSVSFAKPRLEPQRPFAPQPLEPRGPKRRLWIIPVGVGLVVLLVAVAAFKLRDRPETLARNKTADQQTTADTSKIVERVGAPGSQPDTATQKSTDEVPASDQAASQPSQAGQPAGSNPPAAVAGRAALLVEAPEEPSKVKTYLGTVVWRLDNVNDGQNQAVGLAVRADIDLPEDKMKATIIFQKNLDASLPASHTLKVRFAVEPGSPTGNVKDINVPQMRLEDSATGESLEGATVPIIENVFLIGLNPGNSEAANLELLRARPWIDIPIRLSNTRIAKLTFEKTDAGQRDLQEAMTAWAKP